MEPPPNMSPLLHWGNWGIIRRFHFLDPLGGLGRQVHRPDTSTHSYTKQAPTQGCTRSIRNVLVPAGPVPMKLRICWAISMTSRSMRASATTFDLKVMNNLPQCPEDKQLALMLFLPPPKFANSKSQSVISKSTKKIGSENLLKPSLQETYTNLEPSGRYSDQRTWTCFMSVYENRSVKPRRLIAPYLIHCRSTAEN